MKYDSFLSHIASISCSEVEDIELIPFYTLQNSKDLRVTYLSWLNNIDNLQLIASPHLLSLDKPMSFIDESFNRFTTPNSFGFFINYLPASSLIGTVKLDNYDFRDNSAWDGILIGETKYQGLGLSKQTYLVLLSFAFHTLKLETVNGGCCSINYPMVNTFYKLGYKLLHVKKAVDLVKGKYYDHNYFSIDSSAFASNYSQLRPVLKMS
jgi:RimJ/RimL family protein N-acetyltransferase